MTPEEFRQRMEELKREFEALEKLDREARRLRWMSRAMLVMVAGFALMHIINRNAAGLWMMAGGAFVGTLIGRWAVRRGRRG